MKYGPCVTPEVTELNQRRPKKVLAKRMADMTQREDHLCGTSIHFQTGALDHRATFDDVIPDQLGKFWGELSRMSIPASVIWRSKSMALRLYEL
jgi:hypothetical protein